MPSYTFKLDNIHCESCKQEIENVLSQVNPKPSYVHVSIQQKKVVVNASYPLSIASIADSLTGAGFIIAAVNSTKMYSNRSWLVRKYKTYQRDKKHLENCRACKPKTKTKKDEKDLVNSPDESAEPTFSGVTFDTPEEELYRAVYSIDGMTCASCSGSIESELEEYDFKCNVVEGSGMVTIKEKRQANEIQEKIRNMGFDCDLVELLPVSSSKAWRVQASIEGMTCSSCSSSITEAVGELPFVQEINISPLTHSGEFVIHDITKLEELKMAVEDCGFAYTQVDVKEIKHTKLAKKSRTVNLSIEGMYCEQCPQKITDILSTYGDAVTINDPISLNYPYIKFTYVPNPPRVAIRTILEKIHSLSPEFKASIVHPLTLEERSAILAKREQRGLALRLLLTIIIAIPTFILGIVGMQLLPHSNEIAQYLDEPMWVGSVSRCTWALFFLATPVYFFADDIFHRKAFHEIVGLWRRGVSWRRRFFKFGSMNLLMCLGTSVAYFASIILLILSARVDSETGYTSTYFDSVVFLTMFLLMGRLLDSTAKRRTAAAVSLLKLRPDNVQLIENVDLEAGGEGEGEEKSKFGPSRKIDLDLLEPSDFVRIVPGMACPADGIIFEGVSSFDESALTGESMPVKRAIGDQVLAGTVNSGQSSVVVKVTTIEGLLDSIIDVVRQGQMNRAPIERTAEKLTGIFVPIVTFIAVVTWLIWLILGVTSALPDSYNDIDIGGWPVWSLQFAIAVFVVACPCGIGLAAPTALFVGTGLAAKFGIMVRGGGEAFQEGSNVDIVCFDKTGTLTYGGEPRIVNEHFVDAEGNGAISREELLGIASKIESNSAHPLATAVKTYGESHHDGIEVNDVSELAGKGLIGSIKHGKILIGNERLMYDHNVSIDSSLESIMQEWKLEGNSIILLAIEEEENEDDDNNNNKYAVRLMLAASDQIRQESSLVINALQKRGIQTWMISGDNEVTAKSVAKTVGIPPENVIAGVLPDEKLDKIKWLQTVGNASKTTKKSSRAIVAMVGDGINDAPSLSVADCGIAIGSGSDIALSSAKFVLLKSDLKSILILLDIAKKTFLRVKFNFGWALVYNCIGIPVAAGVIYPYNNSRLDPVWASLAMALSSISVVISSLLLKWYKPPKDLR